MLGERVNEKSIGGEEYRVYLQKFVLHSIANHLHSVVAIDSKLVSKVEEHKQHGAKEHEEGTFEGKQNDE